MEVVDEVQTHSYSGRMLNPNRRTTSMQRTGDIPRDDCFLINDLPESLIIHILSCLTMKDMVRTSLLGRRWRHLWKFIPCIDLKGNITASQVDGFLLHHASCKVHKLHISVHCREEDNVLINSWIRFAIRRKVEDLRLALYHGYYPVNRRLGPRLQYELPRSLSDCGSLTTLTLAGSHLHLPGSTHLRSLKTLTLHFFKLSFDAIEQVTSSCPLLEKLCLEDCCNELKSLNVCIRNANVKKLVIRESTKDERFTVTINAPKLRSLELFGCLPSTACSNNLESLATASFTLGGAIEAMVLADLLDKLRHVNDAKLIFRAETSIDFFGALSAQVQKGLKPVPIKSTCLELKTEFAKWELPGIAYLLQSSSNIETLTVSISKKGETLVGGEFAKDYNFDEKLCWKIWDLDSPVILPNTKTINIKGFPFWECLDFHDYWNDALEFVRFLLNNSKDLERMNVSIVKMDVNFRVLSDKYTNHSMLKLTEKLRSFPIASPKARLFIC